jgi:hypothetical protein
MMGSMMRRAMIGDGSTLWLDFTTGQLDPRLTFTRASNATFINSSGLVQTVNANLPRFDYDPTTLVPQGLLIEGAATNLALNSETFPTSGTGLWAYENVTANATKITAPDGTTNAIQFNETTANNVHRIGQSVSASAGSVSVSVWVKVLQPGTPRRLFINANTFMNARGLFDIDPAVQTGASGTAVSVTGTAANKAGTWIKYPNNWYRCTLIGTYSTASTVYFQINRASSSTATDDIFAGSTTNGLAIWGAQFEAGGASSYIPTVASQVTRNADHCTMPTSSFITGTLYPQTLFAEFIPANPSAAFPDIVRLFDRTAGGTFSYGTELYYYGSSTMTAQRKINASTNTDRSLASGLAYNSRHKLAVAVDSSTFLGSYDGLTGSGTTTAPSALASQVTHMGVGCSGDASAGSVMFGTIRQIKWFPFAMTQSQLNALTTL